MTEPTNYNKQWQERNAANLARITERELRLIRAALKLAFPSARTETFRLLPTTSSHIIAQLLDWNRLGLSIEQIEAEVEAETAPYLEELHASIEWQSRQPASKPATRKSAATLDILSMIADL